MDVPTGAMVREWAANNIGSAFDWARYGYPAPVGAAPDRLDRLVLSAVSWIEIMVGRKLDASLTDPGLVALAQDATLMRTEQVLIGRGTTKAVRDALSDSKIKSLRAGDYSQTNRDAADALKARQLNPWGDLSDTLMALATPERRAELLAEMSGKPRPLALTIEPPTDPAGLSYYT